MGRISNSTEQTLLQAIKRSFGDSRAAKRGIAVGIGDDAAVLRPRRGRELLVTTDGFVEGRHFEAGWMPWRMLGARLATVNLSDIAAMGGAPRFGLVSVSMPVRIKSGDVLALERGVQERLSEHGATLVGGNITSTDGPFSLEMTLLGDVATGRAWKRTAKPGDAIVVVGNLGGARAGVELLTAGKNAPRELIAAYRAPVSRLDVARRLAGRATSGVRGAIDVSDGFVLDLSRLCAGDVGAEIDGDALPIANALTTHLGETGARDYALYGGEDYALILSVVPRALKNLLRRLAMLSAPVRHVGEFTKSRPIILRAEGRRRRLRVSGWDHLA